MTSAIAATVTLIDAQSGNTVSSALTDAKGRFVLHFSNGFRPAKDSLYYIEASKGLKIDDSNYNAVGADSVRVRTLGTYRDGVWQTLTSLTGNGLTINQTTTALSMIHGLRKGTARAIAPLSLLGSVLVGAPDGAYADSLKLPDETLIPRAMVRHGSDLVNDALAKNRDPFKWIVMASDDPALNTLIVLDVPFSVLYLEPDSQVANQTIDLIGTNFAPNLAGNKVFFATDGAGSVEGTVTSVAADFTRLTVRVPLGAVNGTIRVEVGGKTLIGPRFRLASKDGHSAVDPSGNIYVANPPLGTVSIVEQVPGTDRTSVRVLVGGLDAPKNLTFGPSGYQRLYVACGGAAKQIVQIDLGSTPPTVTPYSAAGGVANPSGMAFAATGALYVSDASTHQIYVVTGAGAAAQAVAVTGAPLSAPRGLSFGPDGKLYVANYAASNALAVDLTTPTTGTAIEVVNGLSGPWGVAFDNRGNFYVSNYLGNSVYRMPLTSVPGTTPLTFGPITSFASLPSPAGMDADASGYLFVADGKSNGIYRVNSLSESKQIGYGISYPTSIWVDAEGKFILTDTGIILKIDASNVVTLFAQGLSNARGLVRDAAGNFYTIQKSLSSLTMVRPDGSVAQVLGNIGACGESDLSILGNKLYMRANNSVDLPATTFAYQGEVLEFDLTNLSLPPVRHRGILRRSTAMARDESGGPTDGTYYVLGADEATIWRAQRLSATQATVTPFLKDSAHLRQAQDIHVDGSGRIWVADYLGPSGNGSLVVYGSNGAFQAEYETVNKPTNFCSDASRNDLWVNSHVVGGDIRQINIANGAVTRTIGGFNLPRGFAFASDRSKVYVNEWGLNRISKLENYQLVTTPVASAFDVGDAYDLETVNGGGFTYTSGTSIRQVAADEVTVSGIRTQYTNVIRTFKQSDGKLVYTTDWGTLHHVDDGYYTAFAAGLLSGFGRGDFGAPRAAGTLIGSELFSYGRSAAWITVIEKALDGSLQRSTRIETDFGGMASNGIDTAYFTRLAYGTVYAMKNGSLTTLNAGPYGSADLSYGIFYYQGKLYQTNRTLHRLDAIDAATGVRTQIPVGLVAPEL